jgi:hypothetical protein
VGSWSRRSGCWPGTSATAKPGGLRDGLGTRPIRAQTWNAMFSPWRSGSEGAFCSR